MGDAYEAMDMGRPVSKVEQLESKVATLQEENERLKKLLTETNDHLDYLDDDALGCFSNNTYSELENIKPDLQKRIDEALQEEDK